MGAWFFFFLGGGGGFLNGFFQKVVDETFARNEGKLFGEK